MAAEISVSPGLPLVVALGLLLVGGLVLEISDLVLETLDRIRNRRRRSVGDD